MIDFSYKSFYRFQDLVKIMDILRSENGCPWDREQTHRSIRRNFIEEAYEAAEAIDEEDPEHLKEELGDVLLQVVFHARMEAEKGVFDIDDVCDGICKKLILRHPHIFGQIRADTAEEVLRNWESIKKREKKQETYADAVESVAKSLPALMRAEKAQERAAKAGFDWDDVRGAFSKIGEEAAELAKTIETGEGCAEEMGDLLFACVNTARFLAVDPEEALSGATEKFIRRFRRIEELSAKEGRMLDSMSLSDMDKLWDKAKAEEKSR